MKDRNLRTVRFDSVADIYDFYVRTDFDIPFWLSEAKAVRGKVLELTCGTGRVSIPLLKAGTDLACVDYSPEMLKRFRRKLDDNHLYCQLYLQDISELKLVDRYDLIFIPFNSFSEIIQKKKQKSALERIRDHLTERGLFICTLQNPALRISSMDGNVRLIGEFPLPNEDRLIVRSRLSFDSYYQLAKGTQAYERYAPDGTIAEKRSLDICFHLFYKPEFETLVGRAGFEISALYGDYDYKPFDEISSPYMIWKLK